MCPSRTCPQPRRSPGAACLAAEPCPGAHLPVLLGSRWTGQGRMGGRSPGRSEDSNPERSPTAEVGRKRACKEAYLEVVSEDWAWGWRV